MRVRIDRYRPHLRSPEATCQRIWSRGDSRRPNPLFLSSPFCLILSFATSFRFLRSIMPVFSTLHFEEILTSLTRSCSDPTAPSIRFFSQPCLEPARFSAGWSPIALDASSRASGLKQESEIRCSAPCVHDRPLIYLAMRPISNVSGNLWTS